MDPIPSSGLGGAASLLADGFVAEWPATGERFVGRASFIRMEREYPEPWGPIQIIRVVEAGPLAGAEVSVPGPREEYRCCGVYECSEGLILGASEYWGTVGGEPPPGREHLAERFG